MQTVIIIKLVIVVAVLLALVFLKFKPETALAACSFLLLLIYGNFFERLAAALKGFAAAADTWSLPAVVLLIAILGGVMGKTGMLQKMIEHLKPMVRSTKITIVLAPMLIGLLAVTGGAFVSCPLVDELGNTLKISPERKAAINLVYRHAPHFSYPLSASLIVAAQLSGIKVGKLCLILLPVVFAMMVLGHIFLLRDIEDVKLPKEDFKAWMTHAKVFLINLSPIMVTLLLSVCTPVPMVLAVPIGIVIAVIAANCQKDTKYDMSLFDLLFKGVNYKTVLVVFAALFFKACIASVSEISAAMNELTSLGLPAEVILILITLLTSFPTGSVQTPAAIVIPIMLTIAAGETELALLTCLCLALSIFGYYFSPVHMCQLLTIEYFKTDLRSLLREYGAFIPALGVCIAVWYVIAKAVML